MNSKPIMTRWQNQLVQPQTTSLPPTTQSRSTKMRLITWAISLLTLHLATTPTTITLVSAASASVCLASNCLLASPYFDQVFPDYGPSSIGYSYPPALFQFFIVLVFIFLLIWLGFFIITAKQVWALIEGLRRERVIRVPAVWSSARHSITRDVIQQWMQRHEPPPKPEPVVKIPMLAHAPASQLKLCVNTATMPSPTSPSPAFTNVVPEYTLKLNISTVEHHQCLVEVWFGVPMKTIALFFSDFQKFRSRNVGAKLRSPPRKSASPTSPAPASAGGDHLVTMISPSHVVNVQPRQPLQQQPTGDESHTPEPEEDHGFIGASRPSVSPNGRNGRPHTQNGGGFTRSAISPDIASRSSRVAPSLVIDTNAPLPGTAPSPHNSPSHITRESESKHLSQLSLREKEHRGSTSLVASQRGQGGGLFHHALGTGNVLGLVPPTSDPQSPATTGPVAAIGTLQPSEGSQFFLPSEALFALPPTLFPAGVKQQVHLNFPQSWLKETLQDHSRLPMVIFVSAVDETNAVALGQGTNAVGGEITIIQFAPPTNTTKSPSAAPSTTAASSPATPASPGTAALPAPAITQQAPEPDDPNAPPRAGGDEPGTEDEAEEEGGDKKGESEPLSPSGVASATSPTGGAGAQDAITSRVKFERQLVIGVDDAYEMEELYGLDESDAECIICLTDIRDVILLPCKHVCVCEGCFKSIQKCPICRGRIHSHMHFTPPKETADMEKPTKEEEEE